MNDNLFPLDVCLMGVMEDTKEPKLEVPLWHEGWSPGPVSCTIPKLYEPIPPASSTRLADKGHATCHSDQCCYSITLKRQHILLLYTLVCTFVH